MTHEEGDLLRGGELRPSDWPAGSGALAGLMTAIDVGGADNGTVNLLDEGRDGEIRNIAVKCRDQTLSRAWTAMAST